ncbi:condensation domain-containing protein [Pendulispora albinea]|uniref:Condensation domain-containing protein n=1 Tax=Pendulispora albinea TaxID=2741071 RepID=A0ABZ2LYM6_9BACT
MQRRMERSEPAREDLVSEIRPVIVESRRAVRGLELTMAQLGVSDLIVGKVRGDLPITVLHRAAFRMQRRHPGLRARMVRPKGAGSRPVFEFCEPNVRRVVIEEVRSGEDLAPDGAPLWQRVVEREANRKFDIARGYMFRVVWVPNEDDGGHVIVVAHHALVDGLSLMRLLNDLLREAQKLIADPSQHWHDSSVLDPLPHTPAVLTELPARLHEQILTSLVRRSLIRSQRLYATYSPFPIEGALPPGQSIRTHCHFHTGRGEAFRKVREACKRNGVTVGGAFAAATQFASLRLIHARTGALPSSGGSLKFPMTMDFSLRGQLEDFARTAPQMGLLIGASDIGVRVRDDITFWELARSLKRRAVQQSHRRSPLLFHQVLDGLSDLEAALAKEGVDYVASGGIAESVNVSSVGEYPYPERLGSLVLEEVFGLNTAMKGGPMFIVWLRSIGGRFCYNATSAHPAARRTTGDALFASLVELMETCHQPAVERLRLRDYASAQSDLSGS